MITFTEVCSVKPNSESVVPKNTTALPFDRRQRSRLHIIINQGPLKNLAAGIDLPRGTILRNGQRLKSRDGHELLIEAADEPLLVARAKNPQALTVIAYHLGNRHVPIQINNNELRLERDPVLADMIIGLGGTVHEAIGPFDPESGAYRSNTSDSADHVHHRSHHHGDEQHAPRIHDLAGGAE